MAYREMGMVEVREIVRRWLAGDGIRAIARGTGRDRKTVRAYVRAAVAVGVARGGAPPTDDQLAKIATTRRPGRPTNPMALSAELDALRPHETTIRRWLKDDVSTVAHREPPGVAHMEPVWRRDRIPDTNVVSFSPMLPRRRVSGAR
jgi:hypothetical protein